MNIEWLLQYHQNKQNKQEAIKFINIFYNKNQKEIKWWVNTETLHLEPWIFIKRNENFYITYLSPHALIQVSENLLYDSEESLLKAEINILGKQIRKLKDRLKEITQTHR